MPVIHLWAVVRQHPAPLAQLMSWAAAPARAHLQIWRPGIDPLAADEELDYDPTGAAQAAVAERHGGVACKPWRLPACHQATAQVTRVGVATVACRHARALAATALPCPRSLRLPAQIHPGVALPVL